MDDRELMRPTTSYLLRPTPTVWVQDQGRRLIGGSPLRVITLSADGAELVGAWFSGEPVGPEPAHRALARRLMEADMATAVGHGRPSEPTTLAVVIPVKDDAAGLAATLTALGVDHRRRGDKGSDDRVTGRIVVIDDGSEPSVDPKIGAAAGLPVSVVRRPVPGGPGNARNLGVSRVIEPVIVFVDAGVIVSIEQLAALARELAVGDTVAVAPRVRSEEGPTRLARYERVWSPLDMGSEPGLVGPGRRLSYLPSTCLAVWSSALVAAGGFDPDLRYGEDVDLIWRLGSAGWVRYVPHIDVTHPPRSTLAGFVRQRFLYGTAAGPLARRHGRTVAPARLDRRSAMAWAAIVTGLRGPAALAGVWSTAGYVAMLLRCGVPRRQVARIVAGGWVATAQGLAVSTARTWWPVVVVAAARRRFRPAALLLALGWLRRLRLPGSRTPIAGPAAGGDRVGHGCTDLALGILDDSAYALGVWRGSIAAGTTLPLLPHIPSAQDATGQ